MSKTCSAGSSYIRVSVNGTITSCFLNPGVIGHDWVIDKPFAQRLCSVWEQCSFSHVEDYERTVRYTDDEVPSPGRMASSNRGQRELTITIEVVNGKTMAPLKSIIELSDVLAAKFSRCCYQLIATEADTMEWDSIGPFAEYIEKSGDQLDVVTALGTRDVRYHDFIRRCSPDRTWLLARLRSWERGFDWDRFFGRATLARRRGLFVEVHMESNPLQVMLYEHVRDRMLSEGIVVRMLPPMNDTAHWLHSKISAMERQSWGLVAAQPPKTPSPPVSFDKL